jgi:hypothetical protein
MILPHHPRQSGTIMQEMPVRPGETTAGMRIIFAPESS